VCDEKSYDFTDGLSLSRPWGKILATSGSHHSIIVTAGDSHHLRFVDIQMETVQLSSLTFNRCRK
jgi:hypothetical protein